jgi:hypothetical protein
MSIASIQRDLYGADLAPTLADALDEVVVLLRRFVHFPRPEQAEAVALWVAHTHAIESVEQSPVLAITSAVKQSGKSRLLDVLEVLVRDPWRIERPSEAVLYRKIDRDHPTILMDEADTIFEDRKGQYEGIRAVFNAGNRRGTKVSRVTPKGKSFDLIDFAIFGPKAIAGIGKFPETIVDRSIVISMLRRSPTEFVERLRTRQAEALGHPIRDQLESLLRDCPELVTHVTHPDGEKEGLPAELDDRGQDNWESLIALGDLAGGPWPARARQAAIVLQEDRQSADDNAPLTLLSDLHLIFDEMASLWLPTSTILERLAAIDSSPWSEWRNGKALTYRQLSAVLQPFGIKSDRTREERGYSRRSFEDAWSRFPLLPLAVASHASQRHDDDYPMSAIEP